MIIENQQQVTDAVLSELARSKNPRFREIMSAAVRHLHAFACEVKLTEEEFHQACSYIAALGKHTTATHNEVVLMAGSLGFSTLVCLLNNGNKGQTETTANLLGPFWRLDSPRTDNGGSIVRSPTPGPVLFVNAKVTDQVGKPIAGAEVDVWQNGDDQLYAVQRPEAPEEHLRGRFRTRDDGSYAFLAVRPVPYPIPDDGPVGQMLDATGRHPWRPAHIHMIVRADGYATVTTHVFDRASEYLDSDAVFAVKPSLMREIVPRSADDPERPDGVDGEWASLACDIVLVAADGAGEPTDPGRTA
jgi:hydroxyquinol 1,2-dioxygenase